MFTVTFFIYAFVIFLLILCLSRILVSYTAGKCISPVCLVGKTAIITGGNRGLGYKTALYLASRGCRVIIADVVDGEESVKNIIKHTDNPNVLYKYIDLSDFSSIRAFVKDIKQSEERLDILINNAGIAYVDRPSTIDGLHFGMQVNHFGPFLLTYLLVDLLKKSAPSRIVFVSSLLNYLHKLNEQSIIEPRGVPNNFKHLYTYSNSKMCNVLAADGFAKRLKDSGVICNSVHPGLINTGIFVNVYNWKHHIQFNLWVVEKIVQIFSKSIYEGIQTTLHAAVSKSVEGVTGKFFSDCIIFRKPAIANDEAFCEKFWNISEKMVQIRPDEKI